MEEFYLAPHKINENLMKVNEKIIAKSWSNLCEYLHNMQYTLKIY